MEYKKRDIFILILIMVSFIVSFHIVNEQRSFIQETIGAYNIIGPIIYLLVTIISVVLAPINTLFLLPIAVVLWGSFTTALLSIAGWTLGGVIAFLISRIYGKPLIERFISTEKLKYFANKIPRQENVFIILVLARIALPVDMLSYAAGLFLPISLRTYTLATFIGVSPFAFIFSYAAGMSTPIMIGVIVFTIITTLLIFMWLKRLYKRV